MSGVYEGGLKVWDCSFDLADFVALETASFAGKRVIELGCGQGLPGVMALKVGASHVVFQDFNAEVLTNATKPVIELNCPDITTSNNYSLVPGSWEQLASDQSYRG